MGKYFGTDGIRGKAEMFTGDFIEKIVRGLEVRGKRVLIGGDTRESTKRILTDLALALENNGAKEVGILGVFPTPGINFVMHALVYDYAIDVTASHNPYTDNGIKIFEYADEAGVKLGKEGAERIERALDDDSPLELTTYEEETQMIEEQLRGFSAYTTHLREYIGEAADFSDLEVILDCANGATSVVSSGIFEALGAKAEVINDDREFGKKINDGVGSTHIETLQKAVTSGDYKLGAAFDGDGDRCMLVDENGEVVDGDQILAILAKYLKLPAVVATVMANQGLLNWGKENEVEVVTADVGDQNVAAEMRARDIKLGGEQSGHIILPGEAMGDGMLTALMVTKVMAEEKKHLSELASEMKKTPQAMINVPANAEEKEIFKTSENVRKMLEEFSSELVDVHGRVLVRPSGTESLIRITMWGDEQEKIDALSKELADKLTEEIKNGRS